MWKVTGGARREAQSSNGSVSKGAGRGNEEAGFGECFAVLRHPGGHVEWHQALHCDPMVTVFKLQPLGKVVQICLK